MLSEEKKKKVAVAKALEKLEASREMKRGCANGTISKVSVILVNLFKLRLHTQACF